MVLLSTILKGLKKKDHKGVFEGRFNISSWIVTLTDYWHFRSPIWICERVGRWGRVKQLGDSRSPDCFQKVIVCFI
jgi:hypothetical protein